MSISKHPDRGTPGSKPAPAPKFDSGKFQSAPEASFEALHEQGEDLLQSTAAEAAPAKKPPFKCPRPTWKEWHRRNRSHIQIEETDTAESNEPFRLWPRQVSPAFRQLVQEKYPVLASHERSIVYWRFMQFLLFSTRVDRETGALILSRDIVAEIFNTTIKARNFSAERFIEEFERAVLPLNVCDYRYTEGKARTVLPEIHPDILYAMARGTASEAGSPKVDFVTGESVSVREQRKIEKQHNEFLQNLSLDVGSDHPAHELLEYIRNASPNYMQRVLNKNWPLVREEILGLPDITERESARKHFCIRLLSSLDQYRKIHYKTVPKTPRIFAAGDSIHQLPRNIRHMALADCVELDLKACQLAVVAKLWDVTKLQKFLAEGGDIWLDLIRSCGLRYSDKPILKTTIYAILFGMSKPALREQLQQGTLSAAGIGDEATRRFFRHPRISELLKAREEQAQIFEKANGGWDAFGNWLTPPVDGREQVNGKQNPHFGKPNIPSAMAAIVQSYELRLMLSILPTLKVNKQIYLLSWLHDGVTVAFGDSTKRERQIEQLKNAVAAEAQKLEILTSLEHTEL